MLNSTLDLFPYTIPLMEIGEFLRRLVGKSTVPDTPPTPEKGPVHSYIEIGGQRTPLNKLAVWAGSFSLGVKGTIPSNTVGVIGAHNGSIELTIESPLGKSSGMDVAVESLADFQQIGDFAQITEGHVALNEKDLDAARKHHEELTALLASPGGYPLKGALQKQADDARGHMTFYQKAADANRAQRPTGERLRVINQYGAVTLIIKDPHVGVVVQVPPNLATEKPGVVGNPPDNPSTLIYVEPSWGRVRILYPEAR